MTPREQVERAIANYADLPAAAMAGELPDEQTYLATPNRLAFALGWVVANAIVAGRFADSAIDALPIYHPETGWDRFLLTRRVSAKQYEKENANRYGMLLLTGDDAPILTTPGGSTRLTLGKALRDDPEAAIAQVLELFPRGPLLPLDLGNSWKARKLAYPRLYNAVTEIIVEHPGVIAAREIFVDTEQVDGAFHPIKLHTVINKPQLVYDWFLVQSSDRAAFFKTHGNAAIYETDRGTWSTVPKPLGTEEPAEMKRRIREWLRIDSTSAEITNE